MEAKTVLVCNIGAVERNSDTAIGRRFEKYGMSWMAEVVNNILNFRTRQAAE